MKSLNWQKRFLLMFADYREAIDAQQSHSDDLIRLRATVESLQSDLAAERAASIAREREINNQLLRSKFPERTPQQVAGSSQPEERYAPTLRQQAAQAQREFISQISDYREKLLNGSAANSTH